MYCAFIRQLSYMEDIELVIENITGILFLI
jgi:hypothetical protein